MDLLLACAFMAALVIIAGIVTAAILRFISDFPDQCIYEDKEDESYRPDR